MSERFEILEHTADVGLRALAPTCEEAFEAVGEGLAQLMGAWFPGEGAEREVAATGADRPALLAAWVDELLYLHEAEDAVFGGFTVQRVHDDVLGALVTVAARAGRDLDGVGVKAATYHRLRMEETAHGEWLAEIYLDV